MKTPSRASSAAHIAGVLARLPRCTSGAALMEFALTAPAFLGLVIAVFQIALTFLVGQGLETAAESSARLLMTGQAQNASYSASQFKIAVCSTLPPFLNCANLYIDVTTVSSFSAAALAAPSITFNGSGQVSNSFNYAPGTSGAIIVLHLYYLWPTQTGPMGFTIVNAGNSYHLLVATSVFKAESY